MSLVQKTVVLFYSIVYFLFFFLFFFFLFFFSIFFYLHTSLLVFIKNKAYYYGGAISCENSKPFKLNLSSFIHNSKNSY
jgi:predicted outer membrane repeat protein